MECTLECTSEIQIKTFKRHILIPDRQKMAQILN